MSKSASKKGLNFDRESAPKCCQKGSQNGPFWSPFFAHFLLFWPSDRTWCPKASPGIPQSPKWSQNGPSGARICSKRSVLDVFLRVSGLPALILNLFLRVLGLPKLIYCVFLCVLSLQGLVLYVFLRAAGLPKVIEYVFLRCFELPGLILSLLRLGFLARAPKRALNLSPWGLFCPFPGPWTQNAQIRPPGGHFGHFQGQGPKMLELSLLGLLLATSRARSPKCLN